MRLRHEHVDEGGLAVVQVADDGDVAHLVRVRVRVRVRVGLRLRLRVRLRV